MTDNIVASTPRKTGCRKWDGRYKKCGIIETELYVLKSERHSTIYLLEKLQFLDSIFNAAWPWRPQYWLIFRTSYKTRITQVVSIHYLFAYLFPPLFPSLSLPVVMGEYFIIESDAPFSGQNILPRKKLSILNYNKPLPTTSPSLTNEDWSALAPKLWDDTASNKKGRLCKQMRNLL